MGRIKTKKIKRATQKVFASMHDAVSEDFMKNKGIIGEKYTITSKKLRNVIAGYLTRLKKQEAK